MQIRSEGDEPMGMESIEIFLQPKITSENKFDIIQEHLHGIDAKKADDGSYIIDDMLELKIPFDGMDFRGIEVYICISCLKTAVGRLYRFYEEFCADIEALDLYIQNEKIDFESEIELYQKITSAYKEKIEIFRLAFDDDEEIVTTCGKFWPLINEKESPKNKFTLPMFAKKLLIINDIPLLPCVYVTFHYALADFMPYHNIWTREFLGFILPVVFLRCFYIPYITSPLLIILNFVLLAKNKFPKKETVWFVIVTAVCILGLVSLETVFNAAMSV